MQIFGHPAIVVFDPETEFMRRSHVHSTGTESELARHEINQKEKASEQEENEIVED